MGAVEKLEWFSNTNFCWMLYGFIILELLGDMMVSGEDEFVRRIRLGCFGSLSHWKLLNGSLIHSTNDKLLSNWDFLG